MTDKELIMDRARRPIEDWTCLADWEINLVCNFNCEYCFNSSSARHNPKFRGHNYKDILNGFKRTGVVWFIQISGGEPFLQPNFVKLCKELTEKNYISINTNLSTGNVYDFMEHIDPEKAVMHCSLHIDERERLNLVEDFIAKYNELRSNDFNSYVTQVMYPPTLKRFDKIFQVFQKKGIDVKPKIFRGYYNKRRYPMSYTEQERNKIKKYFDRSGRLETLKYLPIDPDLEKNFIYGDLSFKGLLCNAGKSFVFIKYNGDVVRCHGEPSKLGNMLQGPIDFFEEAKPCHARICLCPYYGLRYAEGRSKIIDNDRIIDRVKHRIKHFL